MKNRKKLIIVLSVVLIILIIILMNIGQKENYKTYHCVIKNEANVSLETDYLVYYEDNKVIKNEITKTYRAYNKSARDSLGSLKEIIKQENAQFSTYEGLIVKLLKDTSSVYGYRLTVDPSKMPEDEVSFFETFKTFEEQKNYFDNIESIECE